MTRAAVPLPQCRRVFPKILASPCNEINYLADLVQRDLSLRFAFANEIRTMANAVERIAAEFELEGADDDTKLRRLL